MNPRLEQRQRISQRLQHKLAPRMIQAMEILHLGLDDLEDRVQQELEKNVALERVEPRDGAADGEGHRGDTDHRYRPRNSEESYEARAAMFAQAPDRVESPADDLHSQWSLVECLSADAALGSFLIDNLDGHGFLSEPSSALAAAATRTLGRPVVVADVDRVQGMMVRELEPAGIAARHREQSLRLQMERIPSRAMPAALKADAFRAVAMSLDDLERNRLPKLARALRLPLARLQEIRDIVLKLDPSPLGQLNRESARPVRPDAYIVYDADQDKYVVALARGTQPALRVAPAYEKMAASKETPGEARAMIKEGIKKAKWVIDAIDQRATTLRKVLDEVVALQREWLDKGSGYLRPMPMTDVAGRIGVAISTVSRAVAGKWVATPRGVVEIRRFFSGGTSGPDGRPLAWDAVRRMISEMVASEDKRKPLSDQAMVRELEAKGIVVARRTIVKYRDALGIPSSRLRRRHGDRPS